MNKFCQNCGNKLKPGAKFCPNCGTKQEVESEQPINSQSIASSQEINNDSMRQNFSENAVQQPSWNNNQSISEQPQITHSNNQFNQQENQQTQQRVNNEQVQTNTADQFNNRPNVTQSQPVNNNQYLNQQVQQPNVNTNQYTDQQTQQQMMNNSQYQNAQTQVNMNDAQFNNQTAQGMQNGPTYSQTQDQMEPYNGSGKPGPFASLKVWEHLSPSQCMGRADYWWGILYLWGSSLLAARHAYDMPTLVEIIVLVINIVALFGAIQRLHDTGHSGWWVLLTPVALIMTLLPTNWASTKSEQIDYIEEN